MSNTTPTMPTRKQLLAEIDRLRDELAMRNQEADVYVALLVPILNRMGGETVITSADALAVPDGVIIQTEQVGEDSVKVYITAPPKGQQ